MNLYIDILLEYTVSHEGSKMFIDGKLYKCITQNSSKPYIYIYKYMKKGAQEKILPNKNINCILINVSQSRYICIERVFV